ncbi:MAG TPA: ATP-binding protein [Candidatus Dormibacteraeota bacterium]|nr:ATP-binding protein [Candidatus Dormibacteraeota bacterium]
MESADRSELDLLAEQPQAEQSEQLAVDVLRVVSASLDASARPGDFYRSLTTGIAGLVGAGRVLFWRLGPDRLLRAIPGAYGVDDDFVARLFPAPCDPDGTDLTSQIVFGDRIFRAAIGDPEQSAGDRRVLDVLNVSNAISAPWRAGDERLGVVAAYDSRRPDGFTSEDAWMLQISGFAAGLVWQLKQTEARLTETVERLQRVDSARQLLLRNLSSAVDRAGKRFATELHDDALQKLTAAEMRLAGLSLNGATDDQSKIGIEEVNTLLQQVEEALRKLLHNVRPPSLETPGGLEKTIRERLTLMHAQTGIGVDYEIDIPDEPPYEIKSVLYRQISEALTNVEKHAAAERIRVEIKTENGGIYGAVTDNGKGFIVAERDRLPGHLGLLALAERPLLAGGWGKIRSEPGAGTIVEFWVPLPQ